MRGRLYSLRDVDVYGFEVRFSPVFRSRPKVFFSLDSLLSGSLWEGGPEIEPEVEPVAEEVKEVMLRLDLEMALSPLDPDEQVHEDRILQSGHYPDLFVGESQTLEQARSARFSFLRLLHNEGANDEKEWRNAIWALTNLNHIGQKVDYVRVVSFILENDASATDTIVRVWNVRSGQP